MNLSIVVPVYGAPELINSLYHRINEAVKPLGIKWELILVNDHSPDNSWEIIKELVSKNKNIIGIDLSRNFGQHSAITAGLAHSTGKRVVVMDCDLQDRPEEIPNFWNKINEGYEVVLGKRSDRKDGKLKIFFSKIFSKVMSYLTSQDYDSSIANFGIYDRKVVDAVLSMGDYLRFFPIFVKWAGFKTTAIDIEHSERPSGNSSYTFRKSLQLAFDMMLSFSDKPLRLTVKFGIFMSIIASIVALGYFVGALSGWFAVEGWATVVISIWFLSGIVIFINGIIGMYIAKIFDQTKGRPVFIVREIASKKVIK